MSRSHQDRRAVIALAATDSAVLWFGRPRGDLATDLAHPHGWVAAVGSDGAAATLAQAGLWLCAVWVALAVLSIAASRLPGVAGRLGSAVAGHTVPAVLRRSIAGALGASILLAPLAAGAATPNRGPAGPAASIAMSFSVSVSTPMSPFDAGSWAWPTSTSKSTRADGDPVPPAVSWPHDPPGHLASSEVVVHRGDSLWAIAAHRLGPQADAHEITTASAQWFEANRATIGSDPGLIHPGQHLHEPTEKGHRS